AVNSGIPIARSTWPVAAAAIFIILLLTANGIAQSVRERMPEFAVLETLGYTETSLLALVFAEAVIPCIAGAVLGTGLAVMLSRLPPHYLPRGLSGIPTPTLSPAVLALAIASALLLALAGAAIPMLNLRRSSVTDVLAGRWAGS